MHLPLRAITVFHTAARAGSVSRAAQELGVTPSAVSQQIAALEVHIGTSLMLKVGRNVVLTEAGERYFEMIAENIDRISEATQNARGYISSRSLIVRATPSLSAKWILPILKNSLMLTQILTCVSMAPMSQPISLAKRRYRDPPWRGKLARAFRRGHRRGTFPPRLHSGPLRAGHARTV
jgi:predicted transcriptional regulator